MVSPGMQDGRFITDYNSNSEINRMFMDCNQSQNDLRTHVQTNADNIINSNLQKALSIASEYKQHILPKSHR